MSVPFDSQQHSVPGRLRARVAGLRASPTLATTLRGTLCAHQGIRRVETRPASESVIVSYDPSEVAPAAILEAVRRAASRSEPRTSDRGRQASARSRNDASGELAPLVLSTGAVALALAEAGPALVVGLLALSAIPLARRALTGARE